MYTLAKTLKVQEKLRANQSKIEKLRWEETDWERKKITDVVSDKHLMTVIYKEESQEELLVKFLRMASAQGEGMQETWRELMVGKT